MFTANSSASCVVGLALYALEVVPLLVGTEGAALDMRRAQELGRILLAAERAPHGPRFS